MSPRKLQTQETDPAFYESVGKAIELSRRYQDKSRRDLARASGISYSYLSEIETGRKGPSAEALLAIANALGLTPSQLLGEAESWLADHQAIDSRRATAGNWDSSQALAAGASPRSVFRNREWLLQAGKSTGPRHGGLPTSKESGVESPPISSSDLDRTEALLESARRLSPEARDALIARLRNLRP